MAPAVVRAQSQELIAVKFGLLGTGWWARDTHAPALASAPGGELVGVWGRDPGKAEALADTCGARAYADVARLIDAVEAVAIALPPDVQAPLAERAARAGKHLLLDKPLALSLPDADRVVRAVDEAGVASVVFFTARFQPDVESVLQQAVARQGWDGARATVFSSALSAGSELLDSTWRVERGALWDIAPHTLAALVPVLGRVVEVTAVAGPRETTHLLARHEDGGVSSLSTTLNAPRAASTWEVGFHGESGWLQVPQGETDARDAFRRAVAELTQAADGDRSHRCDARFARHVVAVLVAATTSIQEGRTIEVE
jgi:predicted dehydrogenase